MLANPGAVQITSNVCCSSRKMAYTREKEEVQSVQYMNVDSKKKNKSRSFVDCSFVDWSERGKA